MSDTPKTSALRSRAGALVAPLDEPVVLRRECAQIERELRAERDALREALEKIARVNAMDYEYQAWAQAAIDAAQEEKRDE